MSEKETLHGLGCPRCGGIVNIPEGQQIVVCPYCELRSVVRGERGSLRYQVPTRITRQEAGKAFSGFLKSSMAIARDASAKAEIDDIFLVHLPFWGGWGRVLSWIFGKKRERRGEHTTYKPREVRVAEEMTWSKAACDVGEFGVQRIRLEGLPLEPFDPDHLHSTGMVFEPVGSSVEAMNEARNSFEMRVRMKSKLSKISQVITRIINPVLAIVYHPLWMVRYLYRGRAFQVAVDGHSGQVLYGKAPGNSMFRAAVLVGGMLAGSVLMVDVPVLILQAEDSDVAVGALISFVIGIGLMIAAYRKFRYGEHYEYHREKPGKEEGAASILSSLGSLREITDAVNLDLDL